MNTSSFLVRLAVFLTAGAATGFGSLVVSVVADLVLPSDGKYFPIFILVIIEEFTKLGALYLLAVYDDFWAKVNCVQGLLLAIIFGAGFGIFELSLILLSNGSVPQSAFAVAYVHMATGIFLFFAIYAIKVRSKENLGYLLILLAVLIHLCYNTLVISIAS